MGLFAKGKGFIKKKYKETKESYKEDRESKKEEQREAKEAFREERKAQAIETARFKARSAGKAQRKSFKSGSPLGSGNLNSLFGPGPRKKKGKRKNIFDIKIF